MNINLSTWKHLLSSLSGASWGGSVEVNDSRRPSEDVTAAAAGQGGGGPFHLGLNPAQQLVLMSPIKEMCSTQSGAGNSENGQAQRITFGIWRASLI